MFLSVCSDIIVAIKNVCKDHNQETCSPKKGGTSLKILATVHQHAQKTMQTGLFAVLHLFFLYYLGEGGGASLFIRCLSQMKSCHSLNVIKAQRPNPCLEILCRK